ncbi:putative signal peptide peptidase [Phycisphaera mikurensis NBRC 102666]|uniref:Putative signal peptide peptidase n=1 Tax=Phycisphaera mikurensis (strain NBRC 102666 / KCTC 22515 / FYK2301M01) TaxID=1142394 RepID=I0IFK4_PHYMF|nr:putative signal peptide peptidase [Phycisphaera mikurensis NBRC 102666]
MLSSLAVALLLFSLLLNLYLGALVYAMTAGPAETVLREGVGIDPKHVAVLPVVGVIDEEMAWFCGEALRSLEKPGRLPDALILRVESGGGGVTASDRIWHELERFQERHPDLPVVASFGGVAASGGYYVAAGTDRIFIEPTGFTGSIGVIAQVPTLAGAMDKLGVDWVTLVADGSPRKDNANNLYRDWTEADRAVVATLIDDAYERFASVVVAGRPALDEDSVGGVADGSVFTSAAAVENGLVDEVGYLEDAIASVSTTLGVADAEEARVTILERGGGGLLGLLGARTGDPFAEASADFSSGRVAAADLRRLIESVGRLRIAYRMR